MSISKTGCSLSIFLPPSTVFSGGSNSPFGVFPGLGVNIEHISDQDKSNLVCPQELKGEMEGGHLKALTLLIAKKVLVQFSLPELCSSLVSMLQPLTRRIPSVPQTPGDKWLEPVSEDFNMTKVMTLGRGKGEGPRVGFTAPGLLQPSSPAAAMLCSEDMQLTTVCHEFPCGLHCFLV